MEGPCREVFHLLPELSLDGVLRRLHVRLVLRPLVGQRLGGGRRREDTEHVRVPHALPLLFLLFSPREVLRLRVRRGVEAAVAEEKVAGVLLGAGEQRGLRGDAVVRVPVDRPRL